MAGYRCFLGYKRPKNTKKTVRHLLGYMGLHKWMFLLVAFLVLLSTGANIMGTYLLKPVINRFIIPGDMEGLLKALAGMGGMYFLGALACFSYNQLMVKSAQTVIAEIRRDLFARVQKLPLSYFDAHTHGELMSRFTNDVDTVQEAMEQQLCDADSDDADACGNGDYDDGSERAPDAYRSRFSRPDGLVYPLQQQQKPQPFSAPAGKNGQAEQFRRRNDSRAEGRKDFSS